MNQLLWRKIGVVTFWVTWPLIVIYSQITGPRTRVLIMHDQSVLVVKNWLGSGTWTLPGGGMHAHETPLSAVIREVNEELDIVLEPEAVQELGLHTSKEPLGLVSKYHLFAVQYIEKPAITLQPAEIMEAAWIPSNDLLMAPSGVSRTVKDSIDTWVTAQNLI